MKKFHTTQKWISAIPVLSSVFVYIFTAIELIRWRAPKSYWIKFISTIILTPTVCALTLVFVLSGSNHMLSLICAILILAAGNLLCIYLQEKCAQGKCDIYSEPIPRYFTIVILSVIGFLVLVAAVPMAIMNLETPEHYSDTNGAKDGNLAVIDDAQLEAEASYSALLFSESQSGDSTNAEWPYEKCDFDLCRYSSKRLDGVMNAQATYTDKAAVNLRIDSALNSGNMEIFILIDGKIYASVPVGGVEEIRIDNAADKLILVRVAAECADMSVSISRTIEQ